jgi:hypothetical protein
VESSAHTVQVLSLSSPLITVREAALLLTCLKVGYALSEGRNGGFTMTINRRPAVRLPKRQAFNRRVTDPATIVESKPEMSKLRIGFIESDTSPSDIRELLERFGEVGEVSIHDDHGVTYALVDLKYEDAQDAAEFLNETHWRGSRISVEFANRIYSKGWLSGHYWRPPNRDRSY